MASLSRKRLRWDGAARKQPVHLRGKPGQANPVQQIILAGRGMVYADSSAFFCMF